MVWALEPEGQGLSWLCHFRAGQVTFLSTSFGGQQVGIMQGSSAWKDEVSLDTQRCSRGLAQTSAMQLSAAAIESSSQENVRDPDPPKP